MSNVPCELSDQEIALWARPDKGRKGDFGPIFCRYQHRGSIASAAKG
jgi:hypothetical protein